MLPRAAFTVFYIVLVFTKISHQSSSSSFIFSSGPFNFGESPRLDGSGDDETSNSGMIPSTPIEADISPTFLSSFSPLLYPNPMNKSKFSLLNKRKRNFRGLVDALDFFDNVDQLNYEKVSEIKGEEEEKVEGIIVEGEDMIDYFRKRACFSEDGKEFPEIQFHSFKGEAKVEEHTDTDAKVGISTNYSIDFLDEALRDEEEDFEEEDVKDVKDLPCELPNDLSSDSKDDRSVEISTSELFRSSMTKVRASVVPSPWLRPFSTIPDSEDEEESSKYRAIYLSKESDDHNSERCVSNSLLESSDSPFTPEVSNPLRVLPKRINPHLNLCSLSPLPPTLPQSKDDFDQELVELFNGFVFYGIDE